MKNLTIENEANLWDECENQYKWFLTYRNELATDWLNRIMGQEITEKESSNV